MKWRAAAIDYGPLERFFMRLLFALVVARQVPVSLAHLSIAQPNGLARLADLSVLLNPEVLAIFRYLLWVALVLYVSRIGWSIVLPYMTLLSIAIGSVTNSQGAISHNMQILSLVLVAQTCAHFYTRFGARGAADGAGENRMISWSQQAIVATYLVSAITKLINSSGMWFIQSPLIAVQIVKSTEQSYYNRLDATERGSGLALAEWLVDHPLLVMLMLSAGFFLELCAALALLARRFALAIGLGLLLFHQAIYQVMALRFVYNEYLLWIYLVNVPFWMFAGARWWRSRAAATPAAR